MRRLPFSLLVPATLALASTAAVGASPSAVAPAASTSGRLVVFEEFTRPT